MDNLAELFERDLRRLEKEVELLPENLLWEQLPGISNSCGVLAQHLVGNLNHYIDYIVAGGEYQRNREREFTNTGICSEKLIEEITQCRERLSEAFAKIAKEQRLEKNIPGIPFDYSPHKFLLHLYGHLNYHLGQLNYLRRILEVRD